MSCWIAKSVIFTSCWVPKRVGLVGYDAPSKIIGFALGQSNLAVACITPKLRIRRAANGSLTFVNVVSSGVP